MVRLVRFYLPAAPGAPEAVIARIGITKAYLRLEVPMPPQYPRITISDTCTDEPALIAAVLQLTGIRAEKVDFSVETSDVIPSAVNVSTHEVPREAVAEPVSGFGLNNPVFPAPVVRERPCVELPRNVQSPFRCESDFYSQIRIQESICQNITLDSHVLGFDALRHTGGGNYQQDEHSFYNSIIHIFMAMVNYCVANFTVCPCMDSLKRTVTVSLLFFNMIFVILNLVKLF